MCRYGLLLLYFFLSSFCSAQTISTPDRIYGELFTDVQMARIFPDSKTFVDCIPRRDPAEILSAYKEIKNNPNLRFSLKLFIEANFIIPSPTDVYHSPEKNVVTHINNLWKVLKRNSDTLIQGSSLLPLPDDYIVPGGRFREIYYWDTYFTMLGLKESGEYELMEDMVNNFAFLTERYGHIPNGNRSYYLSRSQPPFFSLMIDLLASVKDDSVYIKYLPALEKEFSFWHSAVPTRKDPDGNYYNKNKWWIASNNKILYRYFDSTIAPRQESFYEDSMLLYTIRKRDTKGLPYRQQFRIEQNKKARILYQNIRSAAESGWDFSSRWFDGGTTLHTINTTYISPVDLNCLVWHLANTLSKAYDLSGNHLRKIYMDSISNNIRINMSRYFFDHGKGWYVDYNAGSDKRSEEYTLAGMYPLFFKLSDKNSADKAVRFLKNNFLKAGGVVTTLKNTGQQWDAPNGWAPLQWITIIGLENYGYHDLARQIAIRWVNLNKKVFAQTGKLMEKYNVVNVQLKAGGGEYPSQDGFGWTNGVLLALIKKYKLN